MTGSEQFVITVTETEKPDYRICQNLSEKTVSPRKNRQHEHPASSTENRQQKFPQIRKTSVAVATLDQEFLLNFGSKEATTR